jgi:hypothetical protein
MLNDIRVVANPRPVAMYRAPPKARLLRMELEYICVEKTSNMGERERKCLASRRSALLVPLSTSSDKR